MLVRRQLKKVLFRKVNDNDREATPRHNRDVPMTYDYFAAVVLALCGIQMLIARPELISARRLREYIAVISMSLCLSK
jgi:hypothetical protein